MTDDLKIRVTLTEYDNMTDIRIMELMEMQQERLEIRVRRAEEERKKREREEARKRILKK